MSIDFSNYVRVTNTHPKTVIGRFNGEDYSFKPGIPEDVHTEVARHVFGFGAHTQKERLSVLSRLGLATTSDREHEGKEFLAGIKFEPVTITPAQISDVVALRAADGETPEGSQALTGEEPDEDEEEDDTEPELPTARTRSRR